MLTNFSKNNSYRFNIVLDTSLEGGDPLEYKNGIPVKEPRRSGLELGRALPIPIEDFGEAGMHAGHISHQHDFAI